MPFVIKQDQDLKNVIPIPAPMADDDDGKGRWSTSSSRSSSLSSRSSSSTAHKGGNNNKYNPNHTSRGGPVTNNVSTGGSATFASTSTRIGDRLSKVVAQADLSYNRSPELIPLTSEYEKMKRNLHHLVTAVKGYQKKMVEMKESKTELAKRFALMSAGSPLFDEIGSELDEETIALLETAVQKSNNQPGLTVAEVAHDYKKRCDTGITSLQGLYTFGSAQARCNDREYDSLIVAYVVEWERLITKLVDTELKRVRKLESDRRHYERKVDCLRQKESDLELKGKKSPAAQVDKLARNEQKLKEAFTSHEREAGKLCALLDAATHDCYKDLYPLLKNYMKWEVNCIGRDTVFANQIGTILESMSNKCGTRSSTSSGESCTSKKSTLSTATKKNRLKSSYVSNRADNDFDDETGDMNH